ncbi:MAG TPA: FAD-dependent oxidoreductase [Symbiobacteriaceae bacterium]|nr:FAD-dependent oxidoreductase [Symbiobacteriaceae bacterium]
MAKGRFGGDRAVVVGGSMAGMVAARVLADHFREVILVERDQLEDGPQPHKGVPQGRHAHGLLGRGEETLHRFFPGLRQDLREHGAVVIDASRDVRWLQGGSWKARFDSGIDLTFCSRPLLEWRVRTHLLRLKNVELRQGTGARGLLWNAEKTRVTGLQLETGDLPAALVVDATGRGSRMPEWLEAAGLGSVAISTIHTNVSYATRIYRKPAQGPDWQFLLQLSSAPEKRLGWLAPLEGDRLICTLVGYHGEAAPLDGAGYLAYAKSLPVPDLYDAIAAAEPISEIVPFRSPVSLRRHYDRMERFPDGLAVTGDAACCFNPVYGQGMTAAALGAEALDAALSEQAARRPGDVAGLSRLFQKRLAAATQAPWMTVATEDFRYAETTGDRLPGTGFLHWYFGRLHKVMAADTELCRTFIQVVQMNRPATDLLAPRTFWKALRAGN